MTEKMWRDADVVLFNPPPLQKKIINSLLS